jgi:hypothetical protein
MDSEPNSPEEDELLDSPDFHTVLRCVRGDETRTYGLLVVAGGVELWRVTESPQAVETVKESDLASSEQTAAFLEELRRSLVAGGWHAVD